MSTHLPQLPLGLHGERTSKLGFGCSGIAGGLGRRRSLALLEAAFDSGIRHFDVAPMYGFGTAEDVVGEFALRHAGWITIATKYGIPPPRSGAARNALRMLVRPVANRFPAVRRRLIRQAGSTARPAPAAGAASAPRQIFTAAATLQSLEASLRKLRVERLDLFLLHEAEATDLNDGLLRMLEDAQRQGKILHFGTGSPWRTVQGMLHTHAAYCRVVQHEWSVLDEAPSPPVADMAHFHIVHRTIAGAMHTLVAWLGANPHRRAAWSQELGADLRDADTLAALLLSASVARAPGIVLFSSRQASRIHRNAEACANSGTAAAALQLAGLVGNSLHEIRDASAAARRPANALPTALRKQSA